MNRFRSPVLLIALGILVVAAAVVSADPFTTSGGAEAASAHGPSSLAEGMLSPMTALQGSRSLGAWGWETVFSEGFEGAFPGATWTLSGAPTWGKTDYRKASGSWSVYAVGGGDGAVSPPGPYPNNAYSLMQVGPFSLEGATAGELSFRHWTKTEFTSNTKRDVFYVFGTRDLVQTVGYGYWGDYTTQPGNVDGWVSESIDLALLEVLGAPQVWIQFVFRSDDSVAFEGVYVDDVQVRAFFATPTPTRTATASPTITSTPTETGSPTATSTPDPRWTQTLTPSVTPTASPTETATVTPSPTETSMPTTTPTPTPVSHRVYLPLVMR